jgi:hypothetical protein
MTPDRAPDRMHDSTARWLVALVAGLLVLTVAATSF